MLIRFIFSFLKPLFQRKAKQGEFQPNRSGGFSFTTHKLEESFNGDLVYKATPLFIGTQIALILGLLIFTYFQTDSLGFDISEFTSAPLFIQIIALIVIDFVLFMTVFFVKAIQPTIINNAQIKVGFESIPIFKVQKLVLIPERVQTKHSFYYSYELNILLRDQSMVTLVDHANKDQIREDAGKIAEKLDFEIVDQIDSIREDSIFRSKKGLKREDISIKRVLIGLIIALAIIVGFFWVLFNNIG